MAQLRRRNGMHSLSRLTLVALLVAACGAPIGATATSSTTPPSAPTTTIADPAATLAAARGRWEASGLDTYHFVFEDDCGECMPTEPRLVVVRDGDAENPLDPTVDSLLETIALALGEGTSVEAIYHSELGYPTEIWIDREARAYDGGTHWLIRDLEAGLP
jgi:hypothetical protein